MLEKILYTLPQPERMPDGTYNVYYVIQNKATNKVEVRSKNYRDKQDAIDYLNQLNK